MIQAYNPKGKEPKETIYSFRITDYQVGLIECAAWEDMSKLPTKVYNIRGNHCDCPAYVPFCKHLRMRKAISDRVKSSGQAITSAFVNPDKGDEITFLFGNDPDTIAKAKAWFQKQGQG